MLVRVLLAILPFLNQTLGNDLVVVSKTEARGRISRQRREASLPPRHWIDIQAEIRSRYISIENVKRSKLSFLGVGTVKSSSDINLLPIPSKLEPLLKVVSKVCIHTGNTHRREYWIRSKRSFLQSALTRHCLCVEVGSNLKGKMDGWVFRFAMLVGGEVFLAEVQEKKKAVETYNQAVSKGQSAGNKCFTENTTKMRLVL